MKALADTKIALLCWATKKSKVFDYMIKHPR